MGEHIPRQRAMVVRERLIQMAGTASPEDCDALIDAARMVEAVIYARAMAASAGLTLRKLAGIMGVSPTTLSQWTATFPTTPPDMMRKAFSHSVTEDDTQ